MKLRNLSVVAVIVLLLAVACTPAASTGPGGSAGSSPSGTAVAASRAPASEGAESEAPESTAPESGAPESEAPESPGASAEGSPAGSPAESPSGTQNPHQPGQDLGERTVAAGEPLHIAFWGVLTGSDSPLGIDAQRGVEVALDDRPELLGREITLTSEDGLCTPEGGNTAATRLAADTSIVGLVGS